MHQSARKIQEASRHSQAHDLSKIGPVGSFYELGLRYPIANALKKLRRDVLSLSEKPGIDALRQVIGMVDASNAIGDIAPRDDKRMLASLNDAGPKR